jgi:hypothetical protein
MSKKRRARCICGCGSTTASTIAEHKRINAQGKNINSLNLARSIAGLTGALTPRLIPTKKSTHRKRGVPRQPVEEQISEVPMDVDLPQATGSDSAQTSANPEPLTLVWDNRASRQERQDEDLVDEPSSPELSEDEGVAENSGGPDPDEPEFLSDDEDLSVDGGQPACVEISASDQLNADFQLRAVEAGM